MKDAFLLPMNRETQRVRNLWTILSKVQSPQSLDRFRVADEVL